MGRPRTATAVLQARGAFKKDPQRKRTGEPVVKEPIAQPPEDFNEGELAAWRQILEQAPLGVLTQADTPSVELASRLMAEMRADWAGFTAGKIGRLQSLLGQFGMNPSDRAKLSLEKTPDANPFDQMG